MLSIPVECLLLGISLCYAKHFSLWAMLWYRVLSAFLVVGVSYSCTYHVAEKWEGATSSWLFSGVRSLVYILQLHLFIIFQNESSQSFFWSKLYFMLFFPQRVSGLIFMCSICFIPSWITLIFRLTAP